MIKIDKLVKQYSGNTVLDIDGLTIEDNEVIGLVGNNGAGKTTLMNILAGIIKPTSGECIIYGKKPHVGKQCADDVVVIDEKMKYCGNTRLNKILSEYNYVVNNFNYGKSLKLLDSFNLDANKKYEQLSKGMKNIFNIIIGFSLPHKVVLFDEITSGLDEFARLKFGNLLSREIIENPKTYILSTHLFGEISNLTEKVLIIKNGKKEAYNCVDDLAVRLVLLRGQCVDMHLCVKGRIIYSDNTIGNYREVVIENNLSRHDKVYLEDKGIEINNLPVSQVCAFIAGCDKQLIVE